MTAVDDRQRLGRRARLLAGVNVAYNGVEAAVAILAGAAAGSAALVGFGLDSVVEVSSGLAKLGSLNSDVDLEFSGGLSEVGVVDVGLDVPVDGAECLAEF
ncbi:MAG: hypothetical protein ACR2FG_09745, partial [Marmoricola sp.]